MPSVTKTDTGDYLFDDGYTKPKLMPRAGLSDATVKSLENMLVQQQAAPVTPLEVSPERVAAIAQQTGLAMPKPLPVNTGTAPTPGTTVDISGPVMATPPAQAPLVGQAPPMAAASAATRPQQSGMTMLPMAGGLPGLPGSARGPMMTVGETTQIMPKLPSADVKALGKAAEDTAKADQHVAEVQAQARSRMSDIAQLESVHRSFQVAAEQESEAARQNEINAQMADIQESVKELATKSVDPNKRWKSMSGGEKFGTALSLMFGALGAAFTKGPNYALDQYEREVDRDIDAQKTEIAKARDMVGIRGNLLSQMMAKGASERQAQAGLRVQRMEEIQAAIRADMLKSESAEIQAKGELAFKAAEERKLKYLGELKLATQDRTTLQRAPAAGLAASQDLAKRSIGLPGGKIGYATDEKSVDKLRDLSANTMTIQDATDRLIELTTKYVGKSIPGQVGDEARSIIVDLTTSYAKMKGQGAMSDDEFERLSGLLKDPSKLFTADSRAVAAAQQFRQRSDVNLIRALQANRVQVF